MNRSFFCLPAQWSVHGAEFVKCHAAGGQNQRVRMIFRDLTEDEHECIVYQFSGRLYIALLGQCYAVPVVQLAAVFVYCQCTKQKVKVPYVDCFFQLGTGDIAEFTDQCGVNLHHIKVIRHLDEMQFSKHQFGAILLQGNQQINAGDIGQPVIRLRIESLCSEQRLNSVYQLLGSFYR